MMMYTVYTKSLDNADTGGNSGSASVVFATTSLEDARTHILKSGRGGRVWEPTSARDFKDGEILFIKHNHNDISSGRFPADLFVCSTDMLISPQYQNVDGWLECCAVSETVPAGWFASASSIQKLKLVAFWSVSAVPSAIVDAWMKLRTERENRETIIRAFDDAIPTAEILNYSMPVNGRTCGWTLESKIDGESGNSEAVIRHIYQMHYAAKICLGDKIGYFISFRLRSMSAESRQALKEWCEREIIDASRLINDGKCDALVRPDLVNLIAAIACLSTKCDRGPSCHHLGFSDAAKAGDTLGLINHYARSEGTNKHLIGMQMEKLGYDRERGKFTVPVTYEMAFALGASAIIS